MAPVSRANVWSLVLMVGLVGCGDRGRKTEAKGAVAQKADAIQEKTDQARPDGAGAPGGHADTAQSPAPEIRKPTIFGAHNLAKVLDLRKLGAPPGTKFNRNDSANLDARIAVLSGLVPHQDQQRH